MLRNLPQILDRESQMRRRSFNRALAAKIVALGAGTGLSANRTEQKLSGSLLERAHGLLLGGMIGDALGGPVEFSTEGPAATGLAGLRDWPDTRQIQHSDLEELAASLPIQGYETLRPDPAPYGPWGKASPVGTVTDDTRHKIVLMRALRAASKKERPVTTSDIAKEFLDFAPGSPPGLTADEIRKLNDEGFREYRLASRWLLGERDLSKARPIERLWGGINNCSGQMMFPPLAILFSGDPELAYKQTYELDFIDAPQARDFTSALNAGVAASLGEKFVNASEERRWSEIFRAMEETDPYGLQEIPFAGRPLLKWLSKAEELADKALGSPKRLYRLLETDGKPEYWWDAHFTLLVPLAILRFCDYSPLAALHVTLDFGHDTDSYAQVLGCLIGAIHGVKVFPPAIVKAVQETMQTDYGENIESWIHILEAVRGHYR